MWRPLLCTATRHRRTATPPHKPTNPRAATNRSSCNPHTITTTPQGVEAVAVHGDKAQEDRHAAIHAFKQGTKDVLVATDVASKVREACVLA